MVYKIFLTKSKQTNHHLSIIMSLSTEHLTNAGEPDMRFKENQEAQANSLPTDHLTNTGEPDMRFKENQEAYRGRDNQPTEHLTNTGEPDMRFKENQEAYGQS